MSTEKAQTPSQHLDVTRHPLEVWRTKQRLSVQDAALLIGTSRINWYRLLAGATPRAGLSDRIEATTKISRAKLVRWADQNQSALEVAA
jgi:hypothetical protein